MSWIFKIFNNLMKNEFWWRQIFEILIIHKPSLGSLDVPQKIWARSVQPFWRLLDTNRQTDRQTPKQTDKPNLYIDGLYKYIYIIYIFFKKYIFIYMLDIADQTTWQNLLNFLKKPVQIPGVDICRVFLSKVC